MKLWHVALAAVAALAVAYLAAKNPVANRFVLDEERPTAAPMSYAKPAVWAMRPSERPPGAWKRPWGVDVFLAPPEPATPYGTGVAPADLPEGKAAIMAALEPVLDPLSKAGPVYAPLLRHDSAALPADQKTSAASDDLAAAFDMYLANENRTRALIIAAPPGAHAAARRLAHRFTTKPLNRDRFAGLVLIGPDEATETDPPPCSPGLEGDCVARWEADMAYDWAGWVAPRLRRRNAAYVLSDPAGAEATLTARVDAVRDWLDDFAERPAEPLPDLETIVVAPINKVPE